MSSQYVLSIDQGTTGSTALVMRFGADSKSLETIGRSNIEHPQSYPKTGWVEHSLKEIWCSVEQSCSQAVEQAQAQDSNFSAHKIASIGITNQRETLCSFDDKGESLYPAIVWQCKRSLDLCQKLKEQGLEKEVREKTGLLLDPYFTATKISWLLQNEDKIAKAVADQKVKFGTIDTFVLYKLTAGTSYATDHSNASRTLLYNLSTGTFDKSLLKLFGIPEDIQLPEIKNSVDDFGLTKGLSFLPDGIPIKAILGDQQAALAGQGCMEKLSAKCTYGTGAFLLTNVGDEVPKPPAGILATVAWGLDGRRTFALEGSCFIAGAAMQFLRDQFNFFEKNNQIESLAEEAIAGPELYYVSSLAGLGAPYWQPQVRGALLGLTRGTTKAQIIRAGIESICLQVVDLVTVMEKSIGSKLKHLNVDGGAAQNTLLLQIQADLLGLNVKKPKFIETTAIGAGLFAAYGAGVISSLSQITKLNTPDINLDSREGQQQWSSEVLKGWQKAVRAVQVFAED